MGVVAVDVDTEKEAGAAYGIKGFPTIKVLMHQGAGQKPKSAEYRGPRTAAGIVDWALEQAGKVAKRRLGGGSSQRPSGGPKESAGQQPGAGFYEGTEVVTLDDATFRSALEEGPIFVEFYAPWCGHCKALKSDWTQLAARLKGKVRVGAVDCTVAKQTCAEEQVQGFPTLKWMAGGDAEAYQGNRDLESLASFALGRWAKDAPPAEVN